MFHSLKDTQHYDLQNPLCYKFPYGLSVSSLMDNETTVLDVRVPLARSRAVTFIKRPDQKLLLSLTQENAVDLHSVGRIS